jgi:hypothetical protein
MTNTIKVIKNVEQVEISKTMSSLELVDLINKVRNQEFEQGKTKKFTKLLHKNFLAKTIEVLGENQSAKFLAHYKDSRNRQKTMYKFEEREAWLMAMSYSYTLQAVVYDTLQETFKVNHELTSVINNICNLEKQITSNGSLWGAMGVEQKKNKKIVKDMHNKVIDFQQIKINLS